MSIDDRIREIVCKKFPEMEGEMNKLIEQSSTRTKECEIEGHKKPYYFEYSISNRSSHRDHVKGICEYCLEEIKRPLTAEEHKGIDEFHKFCREVPIH